MKHAILKRSMILPGFLMLLSLPLAAEIYRCEIEGVIVFSDRPCQGNSEPYQVGRTLSVSGSEDLAETEARNQAWLETEASRRQARREAALAAQADSSSQAASPVRPAASQGFGVWGLPYTAPPPRGGPRGRERTPRDGEEDTRPQDRYSALSGRQPGSRRDP